MTSEVCVVVGVTSHHLFDHKPDNLLSKGSKYNLRGFYRFGTPGVAVVFGQRADVDNYIDSMKDAMPQKKFEMRFQQPWNSSSTQQQQQQQQPLGWTEVELGGLREALTALGLEQCFFDVTGLDPAKATQSKSSSSSSTEKSNDKSGNKQSKGKKKKK